MNGEFRPVFIMGHHRSGTTILYQLLAQTALFNLTTAYHVLNRHRLLALHAAGEEPQAREELRRQFEARGLRDREFDSIKITSRSMVFLSRRPEYRARFRTGSSPIRIGPGCSCTTTPSAFNRPSASAASG